MRRTKDGPAVSSRQYQTRYDASAPPPCVCIDYINRIQGNCVKALFGRPFEVAQSRGGGLNALPPIARTNFTLAHSHTHTYLLVELLVQLLGRLGRERLCGCWCAAVDRYIVCSSIIERNKDTSLPCTLSSSTNTSQKVSMAISEYPTASSHALLPSTFPSSSASAAWPSGVPCLPCGRDSSGEDGWVDGSFP